MSEGKINKRMTIDKIVAFERKVNKKLMKRFILIGGKYVPASPLSRRGRKAKLVYGKGKVSMSAEVEMGEWGA